MTPKIARKFLIASLAIYLLWIAGLIGMAVVSGKRPPRSFDPLSAPSEVEEVDDPPAGQP
jgi:hypothetical protein